MRSTWPPHSMRKPRPSSRSIRACGMGPARKDYSWRRTRSVVVSRESAPVKDVWTISGQFFAEQHAIPGSHPSYRHEEPASPNTCVTLLTGGLLVRIQPEEPIFSTTYRCDSKSKIWTILCGRVDFSCDLRFVTLRNASNFGDRAARPRLSIQAATGGYFSSQVRERESVEGSEPFVLFSR